MIKVVVAGAAGRMGGRLVALVRDSTALTLAGAIEIAGHHALTTISTRRRLRSVASITCTPGAR